MRLMHQDPTIPLITLPPLINGDLCSGTWICNKPAWNPDFRDADPFMMLTLKQFDSCYAGQPIKEMEQA